MDVSKSKLVASVSRAKAELDSVLEDLARIHAFDPRGTRLVAHGLNNLLTVMLGTIDLLTLEIGETIKAPAMEFLRTLSTTAERAKVLVRELFNSSTVSQPDYDFEFVDLNQIVVFAVDYYSRVARQKSVELNYADAQSTLEVWADRIGLAVILDNLLSNAVKYTMAGKKVEVGLREEPDSCLCSVCDQGPGLSEEDQSQLFQPGVRLSAAPTAGEPSTGYGLAVTKKIVDDMRGQIWCDSEHGRGACFRFRLPRNPP